MLDSYMLILITKIAVTFENVFDHFLCTHHAVPDLPQLLIPQFTVLASVAHWSEPVWCVVVYRPGASSLLATGRSGLLTLYMNLIPKLLEMITCLCNDLSVQNF